MGVKHKTRCCCSSCYAIYINIRKIIVDIVLFYQRRSYQRSLPMIYIYICWTIIRFGEVVVTSINHDSPLSVRLSPEVPYKSTKEKLLDKNLPSTASNRERCSCSTTHKYIRARETYVNDKQSSSQFMTVQQKPRHSHAQISFKPIRRGSESYCDIGNV